MRMKIKIKHEFIDKTLYYILSDDNESHRIAKRKIENIKKKKKISVCLNRYLHKKLFNVSRLFNVTGWKVFCTVEHNWMTNRDVLKLNIESFDKILSGELSIDASNDTEDVQKEKSEGILAWMNLYIRDTSGSITLDKIKNKNINLDFNMRLMTNSNTYSKECLSKLKEQYDSVFNYLKSFNINILYDHRLLIKGKDILWYPAYLKLDDIKNNEDTETKKIIDFVMNSRIARRKINPNYYSINDISNDTILKTLFEQNILDINLFDGDEEVTKEKIKEYFDLNKMCSY